eukprot:scaffold398753_cov38-Prasinocladus_malaysianus.AAC.1
MDRRGAKDEELNNNTRHITDTGEGACFSGRSNGSAGSPTAYGTTSKKRSSPVGTVDKERDRFHSSQGALADGLDSIAGRAQGQASAAATSLPMLQHVSPEALSMIGPEQVDSFLATINYGNADER